MPLKLCNLFFVLFLYLRQNKFNTYSKRVMIEFQIIHWIKTIYNKYKPGPSQVGGPGGGTLFGRSVNPISTKLGAHYPHPVQCAPPRFSDLATALLKLDGEVCRWLAVANSLFSKWVGNSAVPIWILAQQSSKWVGNIKCHIKLPWKFG